MQGSRAVKIQDWMSHLCDQTFPLNQLSQFHPFCVLQQRGCRFRLSSSQPALLNQLLLSTLENLNWVESSKRCSCPRTQRRSASTPSHPPVISEVLCCVFSSWLEWLSFGLPLKDLHNRHVQFHLEILLKFGFVQFGVSPTDVFGSVFFPPLAIHVLTTTTTTPGRVQIASQSCEVYSLVMLLIYRQSMHTLNKQPTLSHSKHGPETCVSGKRNVPSFRSQPNGYFKGLGEKDETKQQQEDYVASTKQFYQ